MKKRIKMIKTQEIPDGTNLICESENSSFILRSRDLEKSYLITIIRNAYELTAKVLIVNPGDQLENLMTVYNSYYYDNLKSLNIKHGDTYTILITIDASSASKNLFEFRSHPDSTGNYEVEIISKL